MLFLGCDRGATHLLFIGYQFGNIWISGFVRKINGSTVPGWLIVLCQHYLSGTPALSFE